MPGASDKKDIIRTDKMIVPMAIRMLMLKL